MTCTNFNQFQSVSVSFSQFQSVSVSFSQFPIDSDGDEDERGYLSSPVSSRTQAYMKDCLPSFLDSCSYLCICFEDTWPSLKRRWPISVDLPASTCPTTTRLSSAFVWPLSLANSLAASSRVSRALLQPNRRRQPTLCITESNQPRRQEAYDLGVADVGVDSLPEGDEDRGAAPGVWRCSICLLASSISSSEPIQPANQINQTGNESGSKREILPWLLA